MVTPNLALLKSQKVKLKVKGLILKFLSLWETLLNNIHQSMFCSTDDYIVKHKANCYYFVSKDLQMSHKVAFMSDIIMSASFFFFQMVDIIRLNVGPTPKNKTLLFLNVL